MNKKLFFFSIIFFCTIGGIHAQADLKSKILGEWVKLDIRMRDSSKIYNETVIQADLRYTFQSNDSARVVYNNQTSKIPYELKDSLLTINKSLIYRISKLTDELLILDDAESDDKSAIKIIMQPARVYNIGFIPKYYISKGNDTVYTAKRNYLEPYFTYADASSMDYISERFPFPDYKAGEFRTRFVVTKEGKVRAIEVLNSTHPKYDEDLKKAIKKTEGKWYPAMWEGKPVNVEMEIVFDLGWSEKQRYRYDPKTPTKEDNLRLSASYLVEGNLNFDSKAYKRAIQMYNLSIENNHLNIDAYYMRAASYIAIKQINKACEDLLQLKYLEQKRGEKLYLKYCQKL